jgi:signal transduction histidine kinase
MAEISVIDTGIGIEKDQIPLLFQKFQQLGGLLGRKVGGTGLGLYISKGLVENMGGQIGLVSKAGKGSIFSFTIPIK